MLCTGHDDMGATGRSSIDSADCIANGITIEHQAVGFVLSVPHIQLSMKMLFVRPTHAFQNQSIVTRGESDGVCADLQCGIGISGAGALIGDQGTGPEPDRPCSEAEGWSRPKAETPCQGKPHKSGGEYGNAT